MTFLTSMTSAFTVPLYAQTRQHHRKRKQTGVDGKKEKVRPYLSIFSSYCLFGLLRETTIKSFGKFANFIMPSTSKNNISVYLPVYCG